MKPVPAITLNRRSLANLSGVLNANLVELGGAPSAATMTTYHSSVSRYFADMEQKLLALGATPEEVATLNVVGYSNGAINTAAKTAQTVIDRLDAVTVFAAVASTEAAPTVKTKAKKKSRKKK